MILNDLKNYHPSKLKYFYANAKDRKYQIWERNALSIKIFSDKVAYEKINYIHNNPIQEGWSLCELPEMYKYSSARFYTKGIDEWGILTHYF